MDASHIIFAGTLGVLGMLVVVPACGDLGGESGGSGETSLGTDTSQEAGTEGESSDGTFDECHLECGAGTCINDDGFVYCECPEDTQWNEDGCGPCPVVAPDHDLEVGVVRFDGRFLVEGKPTPASEYDDANVWLENSRNGDRVLLGNTHARQFAVRVTPGIYDVIYEVESPGAVLPHNHRARLQKLALFEPVTTANIDIEVASATGDILLDGSRPPVSEYDDANILFLDRYTGDEVPAGNTHDGTYAVNLVAGLYDIVYRDESPGPITPRNDGAKVQTVTLDSGNYDGPIRLTSVPVQGAFLLNDAPAPVSEYNDANIELDSDTGGIVQLGNTHDSSYELQVLADVYDIIYRHESGQNMPQNEHAQIGSLDATQGGGTHDIDIRMVALSGALTINDALAPDDEFDDGVISLHGIGGDDLVRLGNTHDGSYAVQLVPAHYAVYYAQETSGGVVPYNKQALLTPDIVVDEPGGSMDIDIPAVAISGSFTIAGATPPTSQYDDGRIYLRNTTTGDALLLGSTHDGGYTAVVVPGDYEIYYVQEAGGAVLPGNQNALLGSVSIGGAMSFDVDVPVVDLGGQVLLMDQPAPGTADDGGQLYLRAANGDSVLLGDSFSLSYAAKLVAGTYGVYYRSEASVTMPQNENGRFTCVTVP